MFNYHNGVFQGVERAFAKGLCFKVPWFGCKGSSMFSVAWYLALSSNPKPYRKAQAFAAPVPVALSGSLLRGCFKESANRWGLDKQRA